MKIIQVGIFPLDTSYIKGGVEASVYGLVREQAKTDKVYVIDLPRQIFSEDKTELIEEIEVFRYANKRKKNSGIIMRIYSIFKKIKQIKPDICHIHGTSPFNFLLLSLLKLNKIKTIITVHGLSHIEKRNQFKNNKTLYLFAKYFFHSFFEFLILFFVKRVIVDTKYVENEIENYRRQWKIWRKPDCLIIPQGIDKRYFDIQNNHNTENNILSVGALNKRKGRLLLLDTMKIVNEKVPEAKLTIIGIKSDEEYYKEMLEKINTLHLKDVVTIKTDVYFDELFEYYLKSTIFALHSEEESQGIVFCEAMAAGLPIVATNVGGIPYVVNHNVNGLLSTYLDVDSFANNIIILLQNKEKRENISSQNKIDAHKYSWETIKNAVMIEYKKC